MYFKHYFENSTHFLFFQIYEAADVIQKLHLIAQELPSGKYVTVTFNWSLHLLLLEFDDKI